MARSLELAGYEAINKLTYYALEWVRSRLLGCALAQTARAGRLLGYWEFILWSSVTRAVANFEQSGLARLLERVNFKYLAVE
jgi:hypothetical protein